VQGVIPEARDPDRTPGVPAWYHVGVVGGCYRHANDGCQSAEHAHAADRCAREIVRILTAFVVRSRRLMGRPLGRNLSSSVLLNSYSEQNGE